VDLLGDSDPITILQRQIIRVLDGHDGGTVMAALALTLTSVMTWAEAKSGARLPAPALMLREDLTYLVTDIVQARTAQRES